MYLKRLIIKLIQKMTIIKFNQKSNPPNRVLNISIVGLLVFLQIPVGLVPLLATGKSKNLGKLFNRYFTTLQFVDEWYLSDPFDPKSRAYRTLAMVGRRLKASRLITTV